MLGWNEKLSRPIRVHLKNVYSSLAVGFIISAAGAFVHYKGLWEAGFLSVLGAIAFFTALGVTTRDANGNNDTERLAYFYAFAFCMGVTSGQTTKMAHEIEPSIIPLALFYTCIIFFCFSVSAMTAPEGKYLWMGAPLLSIFAVWAITPILNQYIESSAISTIHLIVGPFIESAFVLYDTHVIIQKIRKGDKDYIWHAAIFLIDLLALLKDILMLLMEKEKKKGKKDS